MKKWALWVLPWLLVVAGCATHYIPNTDVEDNDDNRKRHHVLREVPARGRRAERPVAPRHGGRAYYEDGGNVDAADDMDYAGLKEYLEGRFKDTRAIRYEIRYRRIKRGREDKIYVEYTYTASYRIPGLKRDEWRHTVADNRLELIPDQAAYRILAGM